MTAGKTTKSELTVFLERYGESFFPSKNEVINKIYSQTPLLFYLGIDPTGPDIHLGHSTNLIVLKKLISVGHKVILLIGDFTAKIGDPTDREAVRKPLSDQQIADNMKTYLEQVNKILKPGSYEAKHNSSWLDKMSFSDVVKLAGNFTVQQMIVRDMFQERIKKEKPIGLHEFLYPLMQAYDSVAMKVDGEIGGSDQTFNMLAGRKLSRELLNKEKIVITTKLLENPKTGKKLMSKSAGDYISLNDSPQDMFGKTMALADVSILPMFELVTEVSSQTVSEAKENLKKGQNPKILKEELALELVKTYHGQEEAERARREFNRVFGQKKAPQEVKKIKLSNPETKLSNFLKDWLGVSLSEAGRLIEQKAVSINDQVVADPKTLVKSGDLIKKGPRQFIQAD